MKGLLEYKNFTAEIKDIDAKSMTVTGYWSKFGNVDYDEDIIASGAANKTIAERGPMGSNEIFFLNQHNWAQPHGKPTVLEAQEKGIYFESKIAPTSYGKDALVLYAEGIVVQHSIGFSTVKLIMIKRQASVQLKRLSYTRGQTLHWELTPKLRLQDLNP